VTLNDASGTLLSCEGQLGLAKMDRDEISWVEYFSMSSNKTPIVSVCDRGTGDRSEAFAGQVSLWSNASFCALRPLPRCARRPGQCCPRAAFFAGTSALPVRSSGFSLVECGSFLVSWLGRRPWKANRCRFALFAKHERNFPDAFQSGERRSLNRQKTPAAGLKGALSDLLHRVPNLLPARDRDLRSDLVSCLQRLGRVSLLSFLLLFIDAYLSLVVFSIGLTSTALFIVFPGTEERLRTRTRKALAQVGSKICASAGSLGRRCRTALLDQLRKLL